MAKTGVYNFNEKLIDGKYYVVSCHDIYQRTAVSEYLCRKYEKDFIASLTYTGQQLNVIVFETENGETKVRFIDTETMMNVVKHSVLVLSFTAWSMITGVSADYSRILSFDEVGFVINDNGITIIIDKGGKTTINFDEFGSLKSCVRLFEEAQILSKSRI